MTMTSSSSLADPSSAAAHEADMTRQPLQSLDEQQQLQLQDQQKQQQLSSHRPTSVDDPAGAISKPIALTLSRFSRDCTAGVVFCLRDSNPSTLAPWNSIYIPKHYRVPIAGQRQSSPGECDLVLKVFPRLALPSVDPETFRSQDLVGPCERCKTKKRDLFQVVGPDPAVPSPQRLFFSTGEIRLFFKICCPPSHHASTDENYGYILTFELHHGKRILMSETVTNAGPGMVPEPVVLDTIQGVPHPVKRKMSSSPSFESGESLNDDDSSLPRKRSAIMSLMNLVAEDRARAAQAEASFTTAAATVDPSSPTTAVVPLSPSSYQHDHDERGMRSRNTSLSYDDHAPASWGYSKESRSGSEHGEETPSKIAGSTNGSSAVKQPANKKRQEPHELSELGIGQRASANLHAAYVSGQLRERSKAGLPVDGLADGLPKAKSASSKPKPSHACPEPDCDKSFSRLFNLRSHMRTHSKARPFVCSSCNFAFSRRHDRDRHAKKHLSEKPYKCIVCEATFVRQDALVRHLRMDGVQNQCMAAMEQRSMLLSGENGGGYMLAAKQQAHDEQQREDLKGADDKQKGTLNRQGTFKDTAEQSDGTAENDDDPEDDDEGDAEEDEDEDEEEENVDSDDETRSVGTKARQAIRTAKSTKASENNKMAENATKTAEKPPKVMEKSVRAPEFVAKDREVALMQEVATAAAIISRSTAVKSEPSSERIANASGDLSRALSRAASPHREKQDKRATAVDASSNDRVVGVDMSKQPLASAPRYEKPVHQEYYSEDRFGTVHGSHPRSFYPSPSRSHSRSHSQSQPYPPVGSDYHAPAYHESASYGPPPPPPPGYHGQHSKYPSQVPHGRPHRELQSHLGIYPPGPSSSPSMSRYHDRAPTHDPRSYPSYGGEQHGADPYAPPYAPRDSSALERTSGLGAVQPWVAGTQLHADLSELEPDKSVFDAAMNLLRIRASQW